MKALLACFVGLGIYASPPSTYDKDRAKQRVEYAEEATRIAKGEGKWIAFSTQGKFETNLIVLAFGGLWTPEDVDSYLKNQGRMREMRDLGFKGIAFVQVTGKGKKAKSNLYAAFELNQL